MVTRWRRVVLSGPRAWVLSASVQWEPDFVVRPPAVLFEGEAYDDPWFGGRNYDVSQDGNLFLMVKRSGTIDDETEIVVIQNWFEELKRLVPVN